MEAETPVAPWYKHRWPWLLMSIPFTSICVGVYFAYNAVHGADPMVQEQYYAAGQAINTVIAAGQRADRMGLSGRLNFSPGRIELTLSNPRGTPLPPVLSLQLSHPTIASLDQTVMLVASAPGHYAGVLRPSSASRWDITLAAPDNGWSLSGEWQQDLGASASLTPTDVHAAAS